VPAEAAARRAALPGRSAQACELVDVDGDGLLDVVLANYRDHQRAATNEWRIESWIYLNDGHRWWQYRVVFTREMALFGPVLRRVQLEVGP